MRRLFCALSFALVAALPARADDSSAALGAGGIAFTQNPDVRMADEDLTISPKEVRIRFVFANDSDRDIDTVVAFPLPDIDTAEFYGSAIGTETDDPVNFVGFTVMADGVSVTPKVEQKAFVKNRDVTALLAAAGVPVNPTVGQGYALLDTLSKAKRAPLLAAHAVEDNGDGTLVPQWTARTKFYWTGHFPAHKAVVLAHRYQPVTGQSFFGAFALSGEEGAYYDKTFCLDAPTKAALSRKIAAQRAKGGGNGDLLNMTATNYILGTAKNWRGPIGHFHLTLDKLKPDAVLSLCWDGSLRKTAPTRFEFEETNFTPARDIAMMVVE